VPAAGNLGPDRSRICEGEREVRARRNVRKFPAKFRGGDEVPIIPAIAPSMLYAWPGNQRVRLRTARRT